MGQWSDPIYEPTYLSGVLDRYFQYRVSLETGGYDYSPEVMDVTLEWDHTGTGGEEEGEAFVYHGSLSNPADLPVVLSFSVHRQCSVTISVSDMAGRTVLRQERELVPGSHEIVLPRLPCGIYNTRARGGGSSQTYRILILR